MTNSRGILTVQWPLEKEISPKVGCLNGHCLARLSLNTASLQSFQTKLDKNTRKRKAVMWTTSSTQNAQYSVKGQTQKTALVSPQPHPKKQPPLWANGRNGQRLILPNLYKSFSSFYKVCRSKDSLVSLILPLSLARIVVPSTNFSKKDAKLIKVTFIVYFV